MPRRPSLLLLAALAALAACASPEATRQRGAGPRSGADPGNWGAVVAMHEGSRPYYRTPRLIGAAGMDDLDPARQAQRLSRRGGTARR